MRAQLFQGNGPGLQTQDGCSVELYKRLPYAGDVEFLASLNPAGQSVLELGCGTGRITRRLLELGFAVTAVDNSAEMLAHAPQEALLIQSDIEDLALDERFDVVLLPSCLINHAQARVRRAFVSAAAHHVKTAGQFFLERQDPAWLSSVASGPLGERQGIRLDVEAVDRQGDVVSMTLRYTQDQSIWRHSFSHMVLSDLALQQLLGEKGFGPLAWLDERRCWAVARLA